MYEIENRFILGLIFYFFFGIDKGFEDSMRRNVVRFMGVEICLFE